MAAVPIRPPTVLQPGMIDGQLYFFILMTILSIIATLIVIYLIIWIWGKPILKAASSRMRGDAIIQHFQNSKVGALLLAPINCGAIRHKKISDGTLITTPYGINTLEGHSFVNSWNLIGISIPTFLMGGISRLREQGVMTRNELEAIIAKDSDKKYANIVPEAYNFNDFQDILKKSKNPNYINIQIEHVGDFIESVNQHYTESEITKEVQSYVMKFRDSFAATMMLTAISIFIVAIAIYILMGAV